MSDADAIRDLRYVTAELRTRGESGLADIETAALDALMAEIQQQADRIAWLEGDVAGWRIKLAAAEAETERIEDYADSLFGELEAEKHCHRKDNQYLLGQNQQLRDALERIAVSAICTDDAQTIALEALDRTPSEAA